MAEKAGKEVKRGIGKTTATFVYGVSQYEVDVDAELQVHRDNLQESFRDQAGKYAWFATVHAAALNRVDQCKMELGVTMAQQASVLRSQVDGKGKPPSEAKVTSKLPANEEVQGAENRLIEARRQEGVLRAVKEAFVHRRDMLIQIGYDVRTENRT